MVKKTSAILKLLDKGFNHKIKISRTNKQNLFKEEMFSSLENNGLCSSCKKAIDFDRTKELIQEYSNKDGYKSADALKIFPEEKRIDFIEIKTFEMIFKWQLHDPTIDKIKSKIVDFKLSKKIYDSLTLLFNDLLYLRDFTFTNEERTLIKESTVNYYVATDVEKGTFESFATSMAFLASDSIPKGTEGSMSFDLLSSHLNRLDLTRTPIEISNIKLMSFSELDHFY